MKQKGKQKNYKNKKNTSIFNYDKEVEEKKNKKKKKAKAPRGYDVNEEHFIGMDGTKRNKNKKVIKKLKKEKKNQKKQIEERRKKIDSLYFNTDELENESYINKKANSKRNIEEKNITSNQNLELNNESINDTNQNKRNKNEKGKKVKKLNKKLIKEQKKKQKEIKKLEKIEEKKRKKERIKNMSPRELQKRQARKYTVKYSFVIILLIFAIVLFLLSPIFYVKNIEIEGNSKVSNEEIKSLLQIGAETNIFKETAKNVNKKLKQNKYIEKADVKKVLPSTLRISITEREVEYLLEYANSFVYVDENGNILEISTNEIEGKIKIIGFTTENLNEQYKLNDEDIQKLKNVQTIIKSAKQFEISDKITSINIADENDYQIYMKDESKMVHLGTMDNLDTKMIYVKAIVEKEKGNDGEIFVNMDLNKKDPYFRQNV